VRYNFIMSSQAMARLEATVSGLVQGVYFRQFTQQQAKRLNLVGWVANQADGTVRVVAEGERGELQRLLDFLHRGSPSAHVEHVQTTWTAATGEFTDFRVRYL
jgi:acylphosphatase